MLSVGSEIIAKFILVVLISCLSKSTDSVIPIGVTSHLYYGKIIYNLIKLVVFN